MVVRLCSRRRVFTSSVCPLVRKTLPILTAQQQMATTVNRLLLGSSFEDFTSAMRLDSSNVDDVSVYHLMLVLSPPMHT